MNSIWRKNIYKGAIDSYIKMPRNTKIKGTLLEADGEKIKVSIGNERALQITLDKPMDAEIGEEIIIERRNIVDSKLIRQTDEGLEGGEIPEELQSKYDYILKSFNIPVNEESMEAIQSLENYRVGITRENILSFMSAKDHLSSISEKLDYDIAVKLVEKDVDFEKESLQKVAQEMQKVEGEKRPFSLLRFLGLKKDMTTEEAEQIAYEIYGNKTGKDITDIIKALDKAGLEPSRKNIEQINNIFSKLHNIKDLENKTIIDSVKNKIETSIDNLYKLKNAVVKGTIKVEQGIGQLANRLYDAYTSAVNTVTERDLSQIEDDIKNRLDHIGIKVTDEIVELSKDVISKGLDLTRENLHKIMTVKGAVIELNSGLDYEKTAILMASGIEVDKVDVAELTSMVNEVEHLENTVKGTRHIENITDHDPKVENIIKETKHTEDTAERSPIAEGTNLGLERSIGHTPMAENINLESARATGHVPVEDFPVEENILSDLGQLEAEQGIAAGLDRLEVLELIENIDIKTLVLHMKLNLPNTLESLNISQQLIDGEIGVDEWISAFERNIDLTYTQPVSDQTSSGAELEIVEAEVDEVGLSETLNRLTNTEVRGLDLIAQGYLNSNGDTLGPLTEEVYKEEIVRTIIQGGIPLNRENIQEIYQLKKALEAVADNLTTSTPRDMDMAQKGITIEKMDLKQLSNIIDPLKEEVNEDIGQSQNAEVKSEQANIGDTDIEGVNIENINLEQNINSELERTSDHIPVEENILSDLNQLGLERSIATGLDRLEVLELIENIDIKTLAFHMKLDLPNTLEGLNLSQQLIDGEITIDEWIDILGEQINVEGKADQQINSELVLQQALSMEKTEVMEVLNRLINIDTAKGLDFIAQGYIRANSDRLGPLAEENYKNEIAKAIIQGQIPLNNNNMQELYMLKRVLERTSETLTNNVFQNATGQDLSIDKIDLNDLSSIITSLEKNVEEQGARSVAGLRSGENLKHEEIKEGTLTGGEGINTENTIEIVDKMKDMVDLLKQIPEERKNTIISLLMKNAMPLTLKEVQNLSFFLSNQRQIGHQVDEILKLINKYDNTEITLVAEDLKKAVNKINEHIKKGGQIEEKPYQELSRLLRELEGKSSSLTGEDRNNLGKSGEKLLDSLELQLQLNREDTVLQMPLMMGDQLKNLQIYIMRDKKGSKKIDPKNMSVLLNFDTNNMGNVNIYVGVNYKNIVMKIGLADEKDQDLIEKYSGELEKHLEELGYDLKDLSFRLDNDNHILSMANDSEVKNPKIKRLLDVKI